MPSESEWLFYRRLPRATRSRTDAEVRLLDWDADLNLRVRLRNTLARAQREKLTPISDGG